MKRATHGGVRTKIAMLERLSGSGNVNVPKHTLASIGNSTDELRIVTTWPTEIGLNDSNGGKFRGHCACRLSIAARVDVRSLLRVWRASGARCCRVLRGRFVPPRVVVARSPFMRACTIGRS